MLSSDSALDLLTKAFSESQDHLLAISALGHARCHHFEFEQLLVFLTEQARGILGAKAVFLAILLNSQAPLLVSSPSNHFNIEKVIPLLNCKNNSPAAIQIIQLEEDSPVYVLDQKIKGKVSSMNLLPSKWPFIKGLAIEEPILVGFMILRLLKKYWK